MQEKVLELASHITNPVTIAAFAIAFLGLALWTVVKAKNKPIAWLLASGLIVIGIAPLTASTLLAYRGVYTVRVTVVDPNNRPVTDAEVNASAGEKKTTSNGWEFQIYPQTKPADGKVTLYASVANSYLSGSSVVALGKDYYPSTEIHMQKLPGVMIRGEVIDENENAVAGAEVSLPDCTQSTKSDSNGMFSLQSCVSEGQMTSVRAQKGTLAAADEIIAGQTAQIVLRKN